MYFFLMCILTIGIKYQIIKSIDLQISKLVDINTRVGSQLFTA